MSDRQWLTTRTEMLTMMIISNSLLDYTFWIDVHPIDSNLLASGGNSKKINIYDKRCLKIVGTF